MDSSLKVDHNKCLLTAKFYFLSFIIATDYLETIVTYLKRNVTQHSFLG